MGFRFVSFEVKSFLNRANSNVNWNAIHHTPLNAKSPLPCANSFFAFGLTAKLLPKA
jgi:hypothetical protein